PGDFVVAKNGSQDATFKKYRPRGVSLTGQEVFELAPLNDDYPTLRSDTEPLQIIGVMVEHRRYRKK
ncbi:MAG: LexA family protein, partial [Janthinobacterium lividum]